MLVGSGVARWWWTPIRGGVRVLLAENTRNTSGNRAPLLWEKGNHNCESLAVMSAIILIKNNSLPPHGSGPNWRISVFSPRHLMQLACRVSRFRRQLRGPPYLLEGRNLGNSILLRSIDRSMEDCEISKRSQGQETASVNIRSQSWTLVDWTWILLYDLFECEMWRFVKIICTIDTNQVK